MSSSLTTNSCEFHLRNSPFRARLTRKPSSSPPGGVQLREEMLEKQTPLRPFLSSPQEQTLWATHISAQVIDKQTFIGHPFMLDTGADTEGRH